MNQIKLSGPVTTIILLVVVLIIFLIGNHFLNPKQELIGTAKAMMDARLKAQANQR
jgi:hypothetical protein